MAYTYIYHINNVIICDIVNQVKFFAISQLIKIHININKINIL